MKDKDNKLNFHNGQNLFIGPPYDIFINPDDTTDFFHFFNSQNSTNTYNRITEQHPIELNNQ